MKIEPQLIGLYTITRRELTRMFRIAGQVFLPSVVTSLLYFLIFGDVIGKRMGLIQGVEYSTFITPGLIMMTAITNSYSNVCSSLYSVRFQKSIEEILITPLKPQILLLGYTLGGVCRGLIVAVLVYIVASFFVSLGSVNIFMSVLVIILVSAIFSLAGFANAMVARSFDDVAIVPTFILTPLTYLGGVFYTVLMLPEFWQKVIYINPIFYMINVLRHFMLGIEEVNVTIAFISMIFLLAVMIFINLHMLKKGIGLRD